MGSEIELDSQRASSPPHEPALDEEGATAPHAPAGPSQPASSAPASATPAQPAPAPAPAPAPVPAAPQPATKLAVDTALDDAMLEGVRRSDRAVRTVVVVCGLLLAAGVGAAALVQSREATRVPDASGTLLKQADAALAEHAPDPFQRAIGLYTQALAVHPEDAHTLTSISRAYAIWSEWLREDLHEKPADSTVALADNMTRSEAQRLADQAKQYAERAVRHGQGLTEAIVAHADALRLEGDLTTARTELERARAGASETSAETLRVAALLAIDSAGGVASAGRMLAEQAVAREPNSVRMRLLLARCLLDEKDADGLQQQIEAVRSLDPNHPRLASLTQALDGLRRAKSAPAHKGQAGSPAATTGQSTPPSQPAAPAQAPPSAPAAASAKPSAAPADAAPDTNDPLELVRRGEKALERGAVQVAESAFQRALEIDPQMPRAKTGLGYVALERNQPNAAIAYFRPAAQHGHAEAFIGMGDAYRRLGRTRDALDAYQTYLKRFPDGPRRSIAQHQSELLSEQLESAH
jgi:tetratricopeptide (TPR) repeat protein